METVNIKKSKKFLKEFLSISQGNLRNSSFFKEELKLFKKAEKPKYFEVFLKEFPHIVNQYHMEKLNDDELFIFFTILRQNILNFRPMEMRILTNVLKENIYLLRYLNKGELLIKNKIITSNSMKYTVSVSILYEITGLDFFDQIRKRMEFPHIFEERIKPSLLLTKVKSTVDFENDLILPEEIKSSIEESLVIHKNLDKIKERIKDKKILEQLKRVIFLFYGEPGVGKTYTAQGIANFLNVPLFVVNIDKTQSKWVGENEHLIKHLFDEFKRKKSGILLFDEADSLFGTRIKGTSRSVDAMHNRVLNILLQEIEKINRIVILTTNFAVNFDEAFERRITKKIAFDRPDFGLRLKLWEKNLPHEKFIDNISLENLAEYDLTGAEIKLVCENALRKLAYKIATDNEELITMDDFSRLIEKENANLFSKKKVGFEL